MVQDFAQSFDKLYAHQRLDFYSLVEEAIIS